MCVCVHVLFPLTAIKELCVVDNFQAWTCVHEVILLLHYKQYSFSSCKLYFVHHSSLDSTSHFFLLNVSARRPSSNSTILALVIVSSCKIIIKHHCDLKSSLTRSNMIGSLTNRRHRAERGDTENQGIIIICTGMAGNKIINSAKLTITCIYS